MRQTGEMVRFVRVREVAIRTFPANTYWPEMYVLLPLGLVQNQANFTESLGKGVRDRLSDLSD